MEARKLTKEDLDKVRAIEGFPLGSDEDIIALSNPPYYTACPNPFIEEFIKENGTPYNEATDDYHCEPFAADVSEGKNDPIYNAHSYHTKVPYKAIMRYILHYTKPGDIVFDGFCGTGMTGVAAQMCENPDAEFKAKIESEMPYVKWGSRKAILNDLSPAATFIAYNYNTPIDVQEFQTEAEKVLTECEKDCGWMYETNHTGKDGKPILDMYGNPTKGKINYTVWSDVFICPHCGKEIVFGEVAYDLEKDSVKDKFNCQNCGAQLKKDLCKRSVKMEFDHILGKPVESNKQVIFLINYSVGTSRCNKKPDENDFAVIAKINDFIKGKNISTFPMMLKGGENWGEIYRSGYHHGIEYSHQFYTLRNYYIVNLLWKKFASLQQKWMITGVLNYINKKQSFTGGGGGMPGVLYIASLVQEKNIFEVLKRKLKSVSKAYIDMNFKNEFIIGTSSTTCQSFVSDNTIDYIFTDPPFGANIMYSEASFLWESLLRVFTNNSQEAIESSYQHKSLNDYQMLMTKCFAEYFRVLKPNHWMTVEFHNSKNAVWNAIQESLQRVGFVIADVRTLDKQQGSFKQVTTTSAVQQDLVISAYKPKESFVRSFTSNAGSEESAWDFVRQHLENLPVVVQKNGKIEIVSERQKILLFDRMVAFHIMKGIPVPVDAGDFYRGLDEKFIKRDGMYFLSDQVNEYDSARIKCEIESIDAELFVTNEKTAIAWLYGELKKRQTYAEIQPKFMQEIKVVDKHEAIPELKDLLTENFLQDDDGKWYVPDPTKETDVAKLREKKLLKEFEEYMASSGKLKKFRSEAVRAGFKKLWAEKDYASIVKIANRLPEETVQEDSSLLMYYDISCSRVNG